MHWPVAIVWDKRMILINAGFNWDTTEEQWTAQNEASDQIGLLSYGWRGRTYTAVGYGPHPHGTEHYLWRWGDYPIPLKHWKEMCKRAEETAGD